MLTKAESNDIEYKDTIKQISKIKSQLLKRVNATEKCLTAIREEKRLT